jgi:hypothetical protein
MKKYQMVLLFTISFILVGCATTNQSEPTIAGEFSASEEDMKAIRQVALDYIEGWFEGDVNRMERSLHPDLVKRTIRNDQIESLGADEMLSYTVQGVGKRFGKQDNIIIQILDVYNNIATVKIRSDIYIDYLHIGKINGEWRIINVLWLNISQDN